MGKLLRVMKRLTPGLLLSLLLLSFPFRIQAQDQPLTIQPMAYSTATLAAGEHHDWLYDPGEATTTILIHALSGSLDPALELFDSEGEVIAENNDWAAAFSTDAALLVESGQNYTLRVSAAFGEGDYSITAIPGDMRLQWLEDFNGAGDWTAIPGVRADAGLLRLQTPVSETAVFIPPSAPLLNDIYLQATLRWTEERTASTRAGLLVRGQHERGGHYSGIRFVVTPSGEWAVERTDVSGITTTLESGILPEVEGDLILGLLAQGETIHYFLNGELLGSVDDARRDAALWGIEVTSAMVLLDELWLGAPPQDAPEFPEQLEQWNTANSNEIAAALIEAGLLSENSVRRLVYPANSFTVAGSQQRTFQLGSPTDVYDSIVVGTEIRFTQAEDVACGISARHIDEDNQVIAFVDTQAGAGLLWWQDNVLLLNNYTLTEVPEDNVYHLLLILHGMYAGFYVNGQLVAQNLVSHLTGDFGVSFINYASGSATCAFHNFWVWQ